MYILITAEAQNFDIPTQIFQRRVNRVGLLSSRLPNNKAILDTQELAICEYIERLDLWEMSTRPQIIEKATNYLLFLDDLNHKVGQHWTRQFFNRYPKYFKHKKKLLAVKQKNAHNLKDIEKYFKTFRMLVR